jgi:Arc/MetJ-type ribon-helix-helix transcriptional regulator
VSDHARGSGTRTVEIPERTVRDISQRLTWTAFNSVDGYVAFALDQLLREIDRQDEQPHAREDSDGEPADDSTDEEVADRLESLGYL